MTYLWLKTWYWWHMDRFQKWDWKLHRLKKKRSTKVFSERKIKEAQWKRDRHAFLLNNFMHLSEVYGRKVQCIHYDGENTIQSGNCPYDKR